MLLNIGYALQYLPLGVKSLMSDQPIEERIENAIRNLAPLGSFANDGGLGTRIYNIVETLRNNRAEYNSSAAKLLDLYVNCLSVPYGKP